jgi:hypothetical protein
MHINPLSAHYITLNVLQLYLRKQELLFFVNPTAGGFLTLGIILCVINGTNIAYKINDMLG